MSKVWLVINLDIGGFGVNHSEISAFSTKELAEECMAKQLPISIDLNQHVVSTAMVKQFGQLELLLKMNNYSQALQLWGTIANDIDIPPVDEFHCWMEEVEIKDTV